jgi:hypothetical protein
VVWCGALKQVWVTRYMDYSVKYGLGFLNNNGGCVQTPELHRAIVISCSWSFYQIESFHFLILLVLNSRGSK